MVGSEADLGGILLGGFLVRGRPVDPLGGHDLHRHPVLHAPELAGRNEILHLVCGFRGDEIAGFDLCRGGQGRNQQPDKQSRHCRGGFGGNIADASHRTSPRQGRTSGTSAAQCLTQHNSAKHDSRFPVTTHLRFTFRSYNSPSCTRAVLAAPVHPHDDFVNKELSRPGSIAISAGESPATAASISSIPYARGSAAGLARAVLAMLTHCQFSPLPAALPIHAQSSPSGWGADTRRAAQRVGRAAFSSALLKRLSPCTHIAHHARPPLVLSYKDHGVNWRFSRMNETAGAIRQARAERAGRLSFANLAGGSRDVFDVATCTRPDSVLVRGSAPTR